MFSLIWGVGTLLFGLACKIAGVGLGTNLSMGIIAVIGTFLPLITEDTLISAAGGVICVGLAISCVGLWLATKALAKRDEDELRVVLAIEQEKKSNRNDSGKGLDIMEEIMEDEAKEDDDLSYEESKVHVDVEAESVFSGPENEASDELHIRSNTQDGRTSLNGANSIAQDPIMLRSSRYLYLRRFSATFQKSSRTREIEKIQYPTWKKVGICLATGICAVQLQFAFIFGDQITDLALGNDDAGASIPGSTHESGGAAIIWLLAISLGAPVAIFNGIYASPVPLSSAIRTPFSRHLKLICTTSLPWISHIHIYGVCATTLLPKKVAASIGWPMLMMVTSGQALLLSVFLGEWKAASNDTIRTLKYSIFTTVVGIAVLMCSVAVPTNE